MCPNNVPFRKKSTQISIPLAHHQILYRLNRFFFLICIPQCGLDFICRTLQCIITLMICVYWQTSDKRVRKILSRCIHFLWEKAHLRVWTNWLNFWTFKTTKILTQQTNRHDSIQIANRTGQHITYCLRRYLTSDAHDVTCKWVPPSAAPRGGSWIIHTARTTHSTPRNGVTYTY